MVGALPHLVLLLELEGLHQRTELMEMLGVAGRLEILISYSKE